MQKTILQNSTPIHEKKNSQKTRTRGELPQVHKECLQKCTANIIFNGEKLEDFPLGLGTR